MYGIPMIRSRPNDVGMSRYGAISAVVLFLVVSFFRIAVGEPLVWWFVLIFGLAAVSLIVRNAIAYRQELRSTVARRISGIASIRPIMTQIVRLDSALTVVWLLWLGISFDRFCALVLGVVAALFVLTTWRRLSMTLRAKMLLEDRHNEI